MKEVVTSGKFRKDLKKYKNDIGKMEKLYHIVRLLEQGKEIPTQYKPHMLTGNYSDHMECHIENDFLLIWIDKDVIKLIRFGSHSELFGKNK